MAISKLDPSDSQTSRGPQCKVCRELARLSPGDAAGLRNHLANPEWRFTDLSDALAADEDTPLDLKAFILARHARGECAAREKLR